MLTLTPKWPGICVMPTLALAWAAWKTEEHAAAIVLVAMMVVIDCFEIGRG